MYLSSEEIKLQLDFPDLESEVETVMVSVDDFINSSYEFAESETKFEEIME
jgi:hypothetical protein